MNRTVEATLRVSSKLGHMAPLRQVQRELGRVYSQAEAFNRRQGVMQRAMRGFYAEMLPLITRFAGPAALGYGVYQMGKAASTMEDALFGIQKKTGATEDQLAQLRQEINDLARDVPVSIDEIAAAFERGGAAGIPLDQLREFADLTVKVADAWDMAAEEVGNAFAGFEAGMGIPRDELEAFADLINYLADSGISDERDIVSFIDRVGASLKNFGLAREEIAAYGAAMVNLKMPAEIAARAMDTLTGKLIAPSNLSEKAANALQEIVGDLDRFAKKIENDAGGALDDFWEKLQKFSNADRARLLGALLGEGFDDEVMRLSAGLEELQKNLQLAGNKGDYLGGIAEAAERKTRLWSSQVQLLKNNLRGLADNVGAPALAALNDGLTSANAALDRQMEISSGRERLTAGGFRESEYLRQYRERYEKIHGTRSGADASWKEALAAYGRGDIDTIFGNLENAEDRKVLRERLMASREQFAHAEQARRSVRGQMPSDLIVLPSPRDGGMSDVEQRASYGAATAYLRRREARREADRNPIDDQRQAGIANPLADLERRLETTLGGAGEEVARGGEDAGRSISEAARRINAEAETAGRTFEQMLEGIGRRLGAEMADSFKASVGSVNVNVRRAGGDGATVNSGRTAPDAGGLGPR